MKPLRKHVAVAIDGGGIRGVMVARALAILEQELGKPVHDIFRLATGTSTGAIISAGIAAGLSAVRMEELYASMGASVFRKSWRTTFFPLSRYRYPSTPLEAALRQAVGDKRMKDFWVGSDPTDVVFTSFDLVSNHTCFIKPWKVEYLDWPVVKAVMASSSVPTYFPVVDGRYVDGGVGSYANPCYLAAYEIRFCLNWDPAETTLISLGTGRGPHQLQAGEADSFWAWDWIGQVLNAFLQSADDQQVHLVRTFFEELDFRRFQVDLRQPIEMDDPSQISVLLSYGDELGGKLLNDVTDTPIDVSAGQAPEPEKTG